MQEIGIGESATSLGLGAVQSVGAVVLWQFNDGPVAVALLVLRCFLVLERVVKVVANLVEYPGVLVFGERTEATCNLTKILFLFLTVMK